MKDKLPTVKSTFDSSKHDDTVTRNLVQKGKPKTYADVKRKAKPTELKGGNDVLVKHSGTEDKLRNSWAFDLFTVSKVNRPVIIVKANKMERYLPDTF